MRGGDLIAEYLVRENVPYVFGLCGHGIVGLMDALGQRADRIKILWWDGTGLCLYANYVHSYYTSFSFS